MLLETSFWPKPESEASQSSADTFPGSSHVQFHKVAEKTDTEIWEFAKANDFCIVSQDADFAERSLLCMALHPKSFGCDVVMRQPEKLNPMNDSRLRCLELH